MMSFPFRFLASAFAVLALPVLASAAEPAILAKARARIGSEADTLTHEILPSHDPADSL